VHPPNYVVRAAPSIAARLCDVKLHNNHCLTASMLKKSYALCPSVHRRLGIQLLEIVELGLRLKSISRRSIVSSEQVVFYSRNNCLSGRVQKRTYCHITSPPIDQREHIDVSGVFSVIPKRH